MPVVVVVSGIGVGTGVGRHWITVRPEWSTSGSSSTISSPTNSPAAHILTHQQGTFIHRRLNRLNMSLSRRSRSSPSPSRRRSRRRW